MSGYNKPAAAPVGVKEAVAVCNSAAMSNGDLNIPVSSLTVYDASGTDITTTSTDTFTRTSSNLNLLKNGLYLITIDFVFGAQLAAGVTLLASDGIGPDAPIACQPQGSARARHMSVVHFTGAPFGTRPHINASDLGTYSVSATIRVLKFA